MTQTQTMLISGDAFSGSIAVDMLGTIESTSFNGSIDCSIAMTFDAINDGGFDCDDAEFSCDIAGQSFSCEQLNETFGEASCD